MVEIKIIDYTVSAKIYWYLCSVIGILKAKSHYVMRVGLEFVKEPKAALDHCFLISKLWELISEVLPCLHWYYTVLLTVALGMYLS